MAANHATRSVTAVKVHCPIDDATMALIAAGDFASIDPGSALGQMIAIVRDDGPLGDFGLYRSVIELATGWELFTPAPNARPAMGAAGTHAVSPTAILTLYIPAETTEADMSAALSALVAAHPWEVPVIAMTRTTLVVRAT